MVFTRSAITPPKVNRFGWNLEYREPNVGGGLSLANFGRDPHSSNSLRGIVFQNKKRKICSKNFQVLRLQVVITPQWLQIAVNSRPNGPSMGCLVSIFTIRIDSKSFPWTVRSEQETYLHKFLTIVDGHCGCLAEWLRKSKQTDVGMAAVRRPSVNK